MCASSHFKGIQQSIHTDVLACIANYGFTHFNNGEIATIFTLYNVDVLWGGLSDINVVKIDFNKECLIANTVLGKQTEILYNEVPTATLICILEQLEKIVETKQTEERTH